jgi:hypothetical protein
MCTRLASSPRAEADALAPALSTTTTSVTPDERIESTASTRCEPAVK